MIFSSSSINDFFLLIFFFCNGGLVGRERRRLSIFVHLHVESHGAPQDLLHLFFFLFVPKSSRNNLCFRSRATLCARAHTHTFTLFQSHRLHVKLCVSRFLLLFFSLFHFVRHDQIEGKEDVKEKFDLLIRFLTDGWRDI